MAAGVPVLVMPSLVGVLTTNMAMIRRVVLMLIRMLVFRAHGLSPWFILLLANR
jgi:hypothetical protein